MSVRLRLSLKPRVLVVEDDPAIRDILLLALDQEGYEVQVAEHGGVALELLAEWQPQLIVLDLMMPQVDGWTFRASQLARDDIADIPVIVLTAGENLRAHTDQLRAAAIFPKPFNLEALLAVIRSLVEIGRGI